MKLKILNFKRTNQTEISELSTVKISLTEELNQLKSQISSALGIELNSNYLTIIHDSV